MRRSPDLSVTVNGREIRRSDVKTEIEKALMENAIHAMREAARFRCPAHHQSALRIAATGPSLAQLYFSVDGCCRILESVLEETLK